MLTKLPIYYSLLAAGDQDPIQCARKSNAHGFHVDVMDGIMVKNVCNHHHFIPELKSLNKPIQVHLMGTETLLPEVISTNPDIIFFHPHWCDNVLKVIYELHQNGIKAGIVWNDDNTETYFDLADEILCMTVEPGEAGQTLIENRIKKIKDMSIKKPLWIDGGINTETIKFLEVLPISGAVVGSGIAGFNKRRSIFS